jgi:hypothetical protein
MIEEAQLRGQIDLHGYTVKDAISGIDLILDVLGDSSKDTGLPVGFGWVEWGQGRVRALAGTHTLVEEVGVLGAGEKMTGGADRGAHGDGGRVQGWSTPESGGDWTPKGVDPGFLIVTGRGLHSKGEGPVVKPAIESEYHPMLTLCVPRDAKLMVAFTVCASIYSVRTQRSVCV